MKKVKKAVIPAAGRGTRFLPATKAIPKEMLPIIDKPILQYILEECVDSGIEEVILIVAKGKESINKHFGDEPDLEEFLRVRGKDDLLALINQVKKMVKVSYAWQDEAKGLGHAILCAKELVGDEPFAILLGDNVVVPRDCEPSTKQLINKYEETGSSIIGTKTVLRSEVNKYGIITPMDTVESRLVQMKDMIEKPSIEEAPSEMAALGRYVITPKIFELLENQIPGKGGEIQLTDSIIRLMNHEKVYAYDFEGDLYDTGDKFGYIKAVIDFALDREEFASDVLDFIKTKI